MPSKKRKIASVSKRRKQKQTQKKIVQSGISKLKLFRWGESYTSFLLGIIVVIIGILFVGSIIKTHHTQQTSSTNTIATPTVSPTSTQKLPQEKIYTVVLGDNLWNIAEKFYNNGYKWVDIAKANSLQNPGSIDVNQKLVIPSIISGPSTSQLGTLLSPTPTQTSDENQAIKTETYAVQRGDNLWNIAVRAYGDGYKWVDIAKANNLANPDIIHSGNIFKIPR